MTLMEVIIAIAILFTALASMAVVTSIGSRASTQSNLQSQAVMRCESIMAQVINGDLQPGVRAAPFADASHWRYDIVGEPGPIDATMRVSVTVERENTAGLIIGSYSTTRLVFEGDEQRNMQVDRTGSGPTVYSR